jgi:uncharacterized protein
MKIEFDPEKRDAALAERGLDFADAWQVFEGPSFNRADTRFAYPEPRFQTYGLMRGRMVMFAWTPIKGGIRVISMRKCNDRETRQFNSRLG